MSITIQLPSEVTYQYTPEVARAAAKWLQKRQLASTRLFLAVILLAGVPPIVYDALTGRFGWIESAFTAVLVLLALVYRSAAADHVRRSGSRAAAMRDPTVVITFGGDSIATQSEEGSSTLPWEVVKTVWKSNDFWALVGRDEPLLVIPGAVLESDIQAFIGWKVKQQGGTVKHI
jgi:hypothetical protein